MRKTLVLLAGMLLGATEVMAQPFGSKGTVVIGAENLTGVAYSTVDTDGGDISSTYVSLLGNSDHQTPYDTPRLAFDFFVTDRVSLGGSATYAHVSSEASSGAVSVDLGSQQGFVIAPRAGFGLPLGDRVGLWARGGVTYYNAEDDDTTVSGLGLSLDPALLLFLSPGTALSVGFTANVGLTGSVDTGAVSNDAKVSMYGLTVGLHGIL
jgi:hypothetical protein